MARTAVLDFARSCGFASSELRDIEIAVGESVANAIEHGNKMRGSFSVAGRFQDGVLTIEVRDQGAGFAHGDDLPPQPYRGWGLLLMRSVLDSLSFDDDGATVRLEKRLQFRAEQYKEGARTDRGTE
jgi:anti-sigma regulatory factor (Ser/Thr protein kinase)